ncbi:hypothetical protein VKT23_007798 [Stygiomarasmius scandens]|uniref:Uncharacterized protein n=1 Tax=Marasmiellus scandens TaxID=2682957 RepID=A0ABR1JL49_9AGAR
MDISTGSKSMDISDQEDVPSVFPVVTPKPTRPASPAPSDTLFVLRQWKKKLEDFLTSVNKITSLV